MPEQQRAAFLQSCAKYLGTLPLFSIIKCTCTEAYVAKYNTFCQSSRIAKYIIPFPSLQAMLGPMVSAIFATQFYFSTSCKGNRESCCMKSDPTIFAPDSRSGIYLSCLHREWWLTCNHVTLILLFFIFPNFVASWAKCPCAWSSMHLIWRVCKIHDGQRKLCLQ